MVFCLARRKEYDVMHSDQQADEQELVRVASSCFFRKSGTLWEFNNDNDNNNNSSSNSNSNNNNRRFHQQQWGFIGI